jgi:hypothetical protein
MIERPKEKEKEKRRPPPNSLSKERKIINGGS